MAAQHFAPTPVHRRFQPRPQLLGAVGGGRARAGALSRARRASCARALCFRWAKSCVPARRIVLQMSSSLPPGAPPWPPPGDASASSPALSSSPDADGATTSSCFDSSACATTVWVLILALLICPCINIYCWRRRGIGVCAILALCPGRFAGDTLAMLTVDSNEVCCTTPGPSLPPCTTLCHAALLSVPRLRRVCRFQAAEREPGFELGKWRPWRQEPSG